MDNLSVVDLPKEKEKDSIERRERVAQHLEKIAQAFRDGKQDAIVFAIISRDSINPGISTDFLRVSLKVSNTDLIASTVFMQDHLLSMLKEVGS